MRIRFWIVFLFLASMALVGLNGSDMQFVFQAGIMTYQDFEFNPAWALASVQLAIHLNDFLFVAPEAIVLAPDLKFKPFYFWSPGGTINYKFGDIFAGLGIFRWIEASGDDRELGRFWQIKGQAGFTRGSLFVTLFAFMGVESLFKEMNVGLMVGMTL